MIRPSPLICAYAWRQGMGKTAPSALSNAGVYRNGRVIGWAVHDGFPIDIKIDQISPMTFLAERGEIGTCLPGHQFLYLRSGNGSSSRHRRSKPST
jgi:hypothetical protein